MLSGPVLKQFRTYLKSHVGNGWNIEGRKDKYGWFYPREWGEDAFHQWSPEKIDFYLKEGTK